MIGYTVKETLGSVSELEHLFKVMREQRVDFVHIGDLKVQMLHPYVYDKEQIASDTVDKVSTDEEPDTPKKAAHEEPKVYTNDDILLDPYVGLENG